MEPREQLQDLVDGRRLEGKFMQAVHMGLSLRALISSAEIYNNQLHVSATSFFMLEQCDGRWKEHHRDIPFHVALNDDLVVCELGGSLFVSNDPERIRLELQ